LDLLTLLSFETALLGITSSFVGLTKVCGSMGFRLQQAEVPADLALGIYGKIAMAI
jgi:hypothetical protein